MCKLHEHFCLFSLRNLKVNCFSGTGSYDCIKNVTTGDVEPHYLPPTFSVEVYNLIMFGWLFLAVIAFAILHWGRHLIQFKTAPTSTAEWDFDKGSLNM